MSWVEWVKLLMGGGGITLMLILLKWFSDSQKNLQAIPGIRQDVATIQKDLATNTQETTAVKREVGEVRSDLKQLTSDVRSAEGNVSAVQRDVSWLIRLTRFRNGEKDEEGR
jgi:septal ring factor EnvC (AmiA/AmiB activator)